jgi:hypothetical protein
MAVYNLSVVTAFAPYQNAMGETETLLDSYGDLVHANIYFNQRLRSDAWIAATNDEKLGALREATELIDNLNYCGCKTSTDQTHEFPRNGSTTVPGEIVRATYEIALKLVDGYDPDIEVQNLVVVNEGFSSARTTYNRGQVLEHLRAGIPSSKAWSLLRPFLRDWKRLKMVREN